VNNCSYLAGLLASHFFDLPSHPDMIGTVVVVVQKIAALKNAAVSLQLRG
jgi:hypothetical protein